MADPRVLTLVLAGGEGKRLHPLSRDRAKPAVPFGGTYRLVDFALSSLVNGGFRRIAVLTQYKSHSLDRHIALTWRLTPLLGDWVSTVPAQMRRGPYWFAGSSDAIYQNLNILSDERPAYVIVFGADHIYRMDPRQMLDEHIASGAAVTVAALRVPVSSGSEFGIIEAASDGRILDFHEKPSHIVPMPGHPDQALASMGNYIFTASALRRAVTEDAANPNSEHDMGGDLIPALVSSGDARVYDFATNVVPGETERERGYWRDVGTIDAFYDAHMDLVSVEPVFNLYNSEWPIYSYQPPLPPAKFVFDSPDRRGVAVNSIVASGVIVSGATARRAVLSPGVHLHAQSLVEDSVLFHDVDVGGGAVVRHAIVDKGVVIPPGAQIGVDPERDRERFSVSDGGVVVIGKGDTVEA